MSSVEDYLRGYNEGYKAGHHKGWCEGRLYDGGDTNEGVTAHVAPETASPEAAGSEVLT